MPIELLTVLEWVGVDAERKEYNEPAWELVEEAIRRLHGRERNDLLPGNSTGNHRLPGHSPKSGQTARRHANYDLDLLGPDSNVV